MAKYRIVEIDDGFIPQVKEVFWWRNLVSGIFKDKKSALELIKFDYKLDLPPVYHYVREEELNDSN